MKKEDCAETGCADCVHLEQFKGKDFFNRCALLDIWNLELEKERDLEHCDFFSPVPEPSDELEWPEEKSETVFV